MDNSLPGSSVYGILQAKILEWVVIPFSDLEIDLGNLPDLRIEPRYPPSHLSHLGNPFFFLVWFLREVKSYSYLFFFIGKTFPPLWLLSGIFL